MPNNILAITRTNNVKELAEIYTAVDVFVNPTLEDNFPTTNLEALACGTPVITFNTGGSVESIDNKNGIVVYEKDLNALKKAILKINNNILNYEIKSEIYNKFDRYKDYIELYHKL